MATLRETIKIDLGAPDSPDIHSLSQLIQSLFLYLPDLRISDPPIGSGINSEQNQVTRFLFELHGMATSSMLIDSVHFDQAMHRFPRFLLCMRCASQFSRILKKCVSTHEKFDVKKFQIFDPRRSWIAGC
jgi:hypothetical protein